MNKNTIEEILSNPYFLPWIERNEYASYWAQWQEDHPDQVELLLDAIAMQKKWSVNKKTVPTEVIQEQFNLLQAQVKQRTIRRRRRILSYAAAAVVLLLGLFFGLRPNSTPPQIPTFALHTEVGELKKVTLPDSTKVVLNGNSQLTYDYSQSENIRKVNLRGEAHFDVQTQMMGDEKQKFIVHTPFLDVEVLGTVFTVTSDSIWTTVVLEEGSVQLNVRNQQNKIQQILMQPGQKVIYNSQSGQIKQVEVDALAYNMWTDGKLSLVDRSTEELLRWFQSNYNIEITLPEDYLDKKLTGSISLDNVETSIKMMCIALGLQPEKLEDNKWNFK